MALNVRGALNARMIMAVRPVLRGAMLVIGSVYRRSVPDIGTLVWNPTVDDVELYHGPARLQPNLLWRARVENWRDQRIVQHAVNIQISLEDNTLAAPGDFPVLIPGDYFKATAGTSIDGRALDPQILQTIYTVRVVTPHNNPVVRSLLCDQNVGQVGVPR